MASDKAHLKIAIQFGLEYDALNPISKGTISKAKSLSPSAKTNLDKRNYKNSSKRKSFELKDVSKDSTDDDYDHQTFAKKLRIKIGTLPPFSNKVLASDCPITLTLVAAPLALFDQIVTTNLKDIPIAVPRYLSLKISYIVESIDKSILLCLNNSDEEKEEASLYPNSKLAQTPTIDPKLRSSLIVLDQLTIEFDINVTEIDNDAVQATENVLDLVLENDKCQATMI